MSVVKLTRAEKRMVLDAALKAKIGKSKPVMFFGTISLGKTVSTSVDNRLHCIDFLPYQEMFEKHMHNAKERIFNSFIII